MKKRTILSVLVILLGITFSARAQEDTIHTLIKIKKLRYLGLYVAPEYQYGQAGGDFTNFAGNSVMMIFNNRLSIGVTGQRSLGNSFSPKEVSPLYLRSAFGGIKAEYTLRPTSVVHFTFPVVLGYGRARADSTAFGRAHNHNDDYDDDDYSNDGSLRGEYFVFQPGVHVEANLFRFGKIFAGANYRVTGKSSTDVSNTLTGTPLQGVSLSAGMKLGLFDWRVRRPHIGHPRWKGRGHKD